MIFSIYKDISHNFISIEYLILKHVKDHFFKTIWISIEHKSVSLIYSEINLIAHILEVF